jgi:DNA primase
VLKKFGGTDAGKRALLAAGMIIERSSDGARSHGPGYYDRFRDRVMFPIRDTRGRVIAFGGRIIEQGEPKYLNSPETTLFHKGRELYGLYEARQALRQVPRLLVVEGYMDVVRLSQSGIHYAVATLGTATTPEHLNRLFRVCTEVVFCFDGDRAGRQAAWRALENALPQAKEGRQLRFLFLPDGHDPDTLVGEEGKDAFEARLADALPLSEYFVQALRAQVDLGNVDGRARLAELGKPLVARLPAGVYRELLIDRLAQEVRMPAPRLAQLLGVAADDEAPTGRQTLPPSARGARSGVSAGRGNLVRQAITLLLHYPAAARGAPDVQALAESDRPGLPLLAELLATLREEPELSTAQLLERWREKPDGAHLARLAAGETLVPDVAAANRDLAEALQKLLAEYGPGQRVDLLLRRAADQGLTQDEKIELQGLLAARRDRP